MELSDLIRAVDAAFADTGAHTPRWDDPHDGRDVRDDEYERVTDWDKYAIVAARARAWERAVVAHGLATVVPEPDGVELRPVTEGALPLRFVFTRGDRAPETGVGIRTGDVRLALVPDCGCDACDSGSDGLLDEIDEHVAAVVSGELVHITVPNGWVMSTGPGGFAAGFRGDGGDVDPRAVLADARAGTSLYPVLRGEPWF